MTATFRWPFFFARRSCRGCAVIFPAGMSGRACGHRRGGKFAQFCVFDGAAGTLDVKTFRPRCVAVPGACTHAGGNARAVTAPRPRICPLFIAMLFSSVFLHACAGAMAALPVVSA
ncbi:hypothetical protein [Stenotrophomonas sp. 24(2023)]|uniref:hypothetical protein n=1 Tax=Stenotrophomonas sp. 24(2023) TaxID=3068324 RepID=UPI0027E0D4E4|nr:hypothetical protein [Stenotrophomonas sp. 24(2023)]WMJ70184.1 hypothetical protein Q9R17_03500 [Stenotrophomonas sp. 24(2023)]